jgi:hypothetical protein
MCQHIPLSENLFSAVQNRFLSDCFFLPSSFSGMRIFFARVVVQDKEKTVKSRNSRIFLFIEVAVFLPARLLATSKLQCKAVPRFLNIFLLSENTEGRISIVDNPLRRLLCLRSRGDRSAVCVDNEHRTPRSAIRFCRQPLCQTRFMQSDDDKTIRQRARRETLLGLFMLFGLVLVWVGLSPLVSQVIEFIRAEDEFAAKQIKQEQEAERKLLEPKSPPVVYPKSR